MEKKMETTIWGLGFRVGMDKNMETTIMGYIGTTTLTKGKIFAGYRGFRVPTGSYEDIRGSGFQVLTKRIVSVFSL